VLSESDEIVEKTDAVSSSMVLGGPKQNPRNPTNIPINNRIPPLRTFVTHCNAPSFDLLIGKLL
jgi:hypothetical protein